MYDETDESLCLAAVPGTLPQQQSSTWKVLVSRCHIAFGWCAGPKMYHEFLMPPIPLLSNSSAAIYHGLYLHPLLRPLMEMIDSMLKSARLRCMLREADGALGNEKLHYHLYAQEKAESETEDRPPIFTELFLCQNHQTNLVLVHAVDNCRVSPDAGGQKLLPNLYCSTLFLRMGGHFLRLLASVRHLVDSLIDWRPTPRQATLDESAAYAKEL